MKYRTFEDTWGFFWRYDGVNLEIGPADNPSGWVLSVCTIEDLMEDPNITETTPTSDTETDMVNSPPHYKAHASGVECITVTEHMSFCLGNAVKYIWRADEKGKTIEDLEKARWYLDREITLRQAKEA